MNLLFEGRLPVLLETASAGPTDARIAPLYLDELTRASGWRWVGECGQTITAASSAKPLDPLSIATWVSNRSGTLGVVVGTSCDAHVIDINHRTLLLSVRHSGNLFRTALADSAPVACLGCTSLSDSKLTVLTLRLEASGDLSTSCREWPGCGGPLAINPAGTLLAVGVADPNARLVGQINVISPLGEARDDQQVQVPVPGVSRQDPPASDRFHIVGTDVVQTFLVSAARCELVASHYYRHNGSESMSALVHDVSPLGDFVILSNRHGDGRPDLVDANGIVLPKVDGSFWGVPVGPETTQLLLVRTSCAESRAEVTVYAVGH
jgi:hypothetical protein